MLAIGLNRFPWKRRSSSFFDIVLNMPVVVPGNRIRRLPGHCLRPAPLRVLDLRARPFEYDHRPCDLPGGLRCPGGPLPAGDPFHRPGGGRRDLYADNAYLLKKVTLPLLKPGIISGAMIAFTLSLDDFVISFFTAGPTSVTLPLYIYASVRRGVTPEIHALSTLVLLPPSPWSSCPTE